ncbi:MAG TPA: FAD-dependent oxidoreductase [Solirubrobacteraceae bacterium]|nr:FAD-dependent oxidoreductase [Solirubrobacteraceae bacterium]
MRVAVVGAGVAGLTAAYRLGRDGHACDVYERWPGLGGQAATIDAGDGVLVERYYHHLFMSDVHIAALCGEIGLPDELEWRPSKVSIFTQGASHPFTTPMDLLRFKPLSPWARVRMGAAVVALQRRHRSVEPFEDMAARDWIVRHMGREVYEVVWGPLLRAKFGERCADRVSMAWLWSKLTLRRQIKGKQAKGELLGYPRTSFETIFRRLADVIEEQGGRVLIDRPAQRIAREAEGFAITPGAPGSFRAGHDPRGFEAAGEPEAYDAVLVTTPSDVFESLLDPRLAEEVGEDYLGRVRGAEYHTALCVLVEIDRQVTDSYWTNICDAGIPFIGVIEHTNFVEPERYGGRRFLYVANYVEADDPLLDLDLDGLLDAYDPGLSRVSARWSRDAVKRAWRFVEPAAQPIVTAGYLRRMPPLRTPVPGLVLANTTQVYPEDRGTNYAVRLGDDAAAALTSAGAGAQRPEPSRAG